MRGSRLAAGSDVSKDTVAALKADRANLRKRNKSSMPFSKGIQHKRMIMTKNTGEKLRKIKIDAPIPKRLRSMGAEEAMALSSSIPPTRLALVADFDRYLALCSEIAVIISHHLQQFGTEFAFQVDNQNAINPSKILAYLLGLSAMHFVKVGALVTASSTFLTVGEFAVPTFFGKLLQQLGPSTHFGRQVCITFAENVSVSTFLDSFCGTGGIKNKDTFAFVPVPRMATDTEQYYAWSNTSSPEISANYISAQFNTISEAITKCFEHRVYMKDIPLKAASTELKATPITDSPEGLAFYTAVDVDKLCDLTLPLTSFLEPTMANSPGPAVIAAPVRVDTCLSSAQAAKVAFLFYLADRCKWDSSDTFLSYLRRFGCKEKYLGNLQLNIRQINWTGVLQAATTYILSIVPGADTQTVWYFFVYCVCIIIASIPPALRAVQVTQNSWGVSRMYKEYEFYPMYVGPYSGSKMPPFLAEIVAAVRAPTRTGNSLNWFFASLPQLGDYSDCWWALIAYNNTGNFGSAGFSTNYQATPIPIEQCGASWTGGSFNPYPSFSMTNTPPSGYVYILKPYLPLNALANLSAYFQNKLVNNGQAVTNTWLTRSPKFTSRNSTYYIITEPGKTLINGGLTIQTVKAKQISSWEPIGYHAALLASCNLINYYMPLMETESVLASIFAATPNSTQQAAITTAHTSAYPGQGTTAAIKSGTASNPEEVISHVGAEGVSGLIHDSSQQPPEHLVGKVTNKINDLCSSQPVHKAEEVAHKGTSLVQNTLKTAEAFL